MFVKLSVTVSPSAWKLNTQNIFIFLPKFEARKTRLQNCFYTLMMAQRSSLVNITVKGMLFLLLLVHQGRIGLALAAGSSEELADGQKEVS